MPYTTSCEIHVLAGKFIGQLGSHRLFRTWCSWLPGTTASFGAVMAIIYYILTATAFITRPILALGPSQLLQSQNISGFLTYYLLQIVPTPSDCVALPQYPLAFLACSAVVAYYIAAWVMLADRGFSFIPLRPTPTSTSTSYTNAGEHHSVWPFMIPLQHIYPLHMVLHLHTTHGAFMTWRLTVTSAYTCTC